MLNVKGDCWIQNADCLQAYLGKGLLCQLCGARQKPEGALFHVGVVHNRLEGLVPPELAGRVSAQPRALRGKSRRGVASSLARQAQVEQQFLANRAEKGRCIDGLDREDNNQVGQKLMLLEQVDNGEVEVEQERNCIDGFAKEDVNQEGQKLLAMGPKFLDKRDEESNSFGGLTTQVDNLPSQKLMSMEQKEFLDKEEGEENCIDKLCPEEDNQIEKRFTESSSPASIDGLPVHHGQKNNASDVRQGLVKHREATDVGIQLFAVGQEPVSDNEEEGFGQAEQTEVTRRLKDGGGIKSDELRCPLPDCNKLLAVEPLGEAMQRDRLAKHLVHHYEAQLRLFVGAGWCLLCGTRQHHNTMLTHVGLRHNVLETLVPPRVAAITRRDTARKKQLGASKKKNRGLLGIVWSET